MNTATRTFQENCDMITRKASVGDMTQASDT